VDGDLVTAKELRDLTLRVPDDAEVRVVVGEDETEGDIVEACATVGVTPALGKFLIVERVW
jgi:hypothetical protein